MQILIRYLKPIAFVQMYYVTHFWSIIRRSFSKYRNYRQIVCNQKKKQFMTQIQKWSEDLYCSLYWQESEGDKASDLGLQSLAIRDSIKKVAKIIKHVFWNEANYIVMLYNFRFNITFMKN